MAPIPQPTKSEVVYTPPNPDGSRKSCSNCFLWVSDKQCLIHAEDLYVPSNAVCSYHIYGKPEKDAKKPAGLQVVTPDISGLIVVPDGVSCDICAAFDRSNGTYCKMLNEEDNKVETKGCCSRWNPVEKREDIYEIKKGNHEVVRRLTFQGMKIAIETDKGQMRHWHDPTSGKRGSTKMAFPYGYFMGTKASDEAGDGMALDVFVGPEETVDEIYVISQLKTPEFKEFDEYKVMLGFESVKQAKAAYLSHYDDERFLDKIETYTLEEFKNKYIKPALEKALSTAPIVSPLQSSGPMTAMQNPNPTSTQAGPFGMMMNQKPPLDVETLDGVNSALNRLGKMKDDELLKLSEEIWGPGYSYTNVTADHVRCELQGFLWDMKELLETAAEIQTSLSGSLDQTSPSLSPNLGNGTPNTSEELGVQS